MANSKTYVSISELKSISQSLDVQRSQIYSTYKNKIVPVLESSDKCFYVAGLQTKEIITNFNTIFSNKSKINSRLSGLVNVLNNNVIAQYNEISLAIAQMFNKDFASRLRELLNLKVAVQWDSVPFNGKK